MKMTHFGDDLQVETNIAELIDYVNNRINALNIQLAQEDEELAGEFNRAGEAAESNIDVAGNIAVDSFLFDAVASSFGLEMGGLFGIDNPVLAQAFNHLVIAGPEAISAIMDTQIQGAKRRIGGLYPEGRRQVSLKKPTSEKLIKRFNTASNQNMRFQRDGESEAVYLASLVSNLQKLTAKGVQNVTIKRKEGLIEALKRAKKPSATYMMNGAYRMAA